MNLPSDSCVHSEYAIGEPVPRTEDPTLLRGEGRGAGGGARDRAAAGGGARERGGQARCAAALRRRSRERGARFPLRRAGEGGGGISKCFPRFQVKAEKYPGRGGGDGAEGGA